MNRLITYFIFAVRIQHALSWALPHPPSIPQAQQQKPMFGAAYSPGSEDDDDYSDVDIVDRRQFQGSHTYANLPHAVTGRPGARYGPSGIRTGSQRIHGGDYSIYTGKSILDRWATIVDCGDAPLTWLDNKYALRQLDKAHRVVSGRKASNESHSVTPRIVTFGGDHTTTLSALRSVHQRWGPVSVIHFDSHIDTWDPKPQWGRLSDYARLNHATFLHIANEEHLISNTSIHAGTRGPIFRAPEDVRNDVRCGFAMIRARDLDKIGTDGVIRQIKDRVGDSKVYISVDIDVLDPAFAPATGTAEPGGWSTRELLTILDGLQGLSVVGADVVEVAPIYDNPGETTVLAAAEVTLSLIELMVENPVKSLADTI
ncbi:proclavaminate amidinohydrolase [Apiospora kogelbergensis]|uniref:Proclavaminate amidinohydrolase n=1 Tax=Apiospora kogelbergensis TaxID=1337665 RepID=A0AAW0RC68_9PEZI